MVKFTVKDDTSGVASKIAKIKSDSGLGNFAAMEAARIMQRYVPERDSVLVGSTTFAPWEVTYNTPYAHYQYEGRNIRHRTKPGSISHWDRGISMIPANKAALANALSAYIKSRL